MAGQDAASPARGSSSMKKWWRRNHRVASAWLCTLLAVGTVLLAGPRTILDGTLFDLGVAVRWHLTGTRPVTQVAVVAIDRESLADDETLSMPRAMLQPLWGELADTMMDAGARVVVYDLIFQFAGNRFVPNHDRSLLQALDRAKGKVVLGRTADTFPATPFQVAAGVRKNVHALGLTEMLHDDDGVVRTIETMFDGADGKRYPTLVGSALNLVGIDLKGQPVRWLPAGPVETAVPTYRFLDVLRCGRTEEGRARLQALFGGRLVFVGSNLPVEDRKVPPDRFLLGQGPDPVPPPLAAEGCRLPVMGFSGISTKTVPGVHLHAMAAEAVLTGRTLAETPLAAVAALAGVAAALAALLGTAFSWWRAAVGVWVIMGSLVLASWLAAPLGLDLPVSLPLIAAAGSMPIAFGIRYLVEERRRRQLQHAFGHYLAPAIVTQLAEDEKGPRLGGEDRVITCMFADLSGFTALSTKVPPERLMQITNRYLSLLVDAVDQSGGYVDKFIGDAVMAMWNAPMELPDHADAAVRAGLHAVELVTRTAAEDAKDGLPSFTVKIGLNSGHAIVGNLGAEKRFSYSAVGETINIASRLEGLPPNYGLSLVIAEDTARLLGPDWWLVELDLARVKGREKPVPLFMPLPAGDDKAGFDRFLSAWTEALQAYRAGHFTQAAQGWRTLPPLPGWPDREFPPAEVLAGRADKLAADPPAQWEGVWVFAKG